MAKLRRFQVDSLATATPGALVALPEGEAHHARVLRLASGSAIEVFDSSGRVAAAKLVSGENSDLSAEIVSIRTQQNARAELLLATAWPKGKRAAVLVEKCSELGVRAILPVRFDRSVVTKDEESEGLSRLRRIAAEAAKQCGRGDVPDIRAEQTLLQVIESAGAETRCVLLDPRAEKTLLELLENMNADDRPLLLLIGPEGGFSPEELALTDARNVSRARLTQHVLRIETAALAACAIAAAVAFNAKA
ncbi:MAG TPA: 16S rRNA (uracil(1498)-N(3))-methyltransferase [Planctomycetota bacterium]